MNAGTRHHITQIDRTILQLLNERARLAPPGEGASVDHEPHVLDLMRRSPGPYPAKGLRRTFETIYAGCEERDQ
ncbi:MAG: hypothetical protein GY930_07050 [bacterium]|nr:hypothetical protein [bacterium]